VIPGVYLFPASRPNPPDLNNPPGIDRHISKDRGAAIAVYDLAAPNHEIKCTCHGAILPRTDTETPPRLPWTPPRLLSFGQHRLIFGQSWIGCSK